MLCVMLGNQPNEYEYNKFILHTTEGERNNFPYFKQFYSMLSPFRSLFLHFSTELHNSRILLIMYRLAFKIHFKPFNQDFHQKMISNLCYSHTGKINTNHLQTREKNAFSIIQLSGKKCEENKYCSLIYADM